MKKSLIWAVGALAILGASLVQAAPAKVAQAKTPTLMTMSHKKLHKGMQVSKSKKHHRTAAHLKHKVAHLKHKKVLKTKTA
ncbi:MAG: hypothetical protein C4331_10290 [Meiothermus sp.]